MCMCERNTDDQSFTKSKYTYDPTKLEYFHVICNLKGFERYTIYTPEE